MGFDITLHPLINQLINEHTETIFRLFAYPTVGWQLSRLEMEKAEDS